MWATLLTSLAVKGGDNWVEAEGDAEDRGQCLFVLR